MHVFICHVWMRKWDLRTAFMEYIKYFYSSFGQFWSLTGGFHYMDKSHHMNILPSNLLHWPCNLTICVLQSLLFMICKFRRVSWPEAVRLVTWETTFITDTDYFTCSRFMHAGSFFCKSARVSDMIHTSAHLLLALTWSINSY